MNIPVALHRFMAERAGAKASRELGPALPADHLPGSARPGARLSCHVAVIEQQRLSP
jgi:hypothetical protein